MTTAPPAMQGSRAMRQPGLLVYLGGVATSALVLWIVHLLGAHGENVLGWYAWGILPVGAILVGALSGSGYPLASYAFDIKLTRAFVLGMLSTGVLDYAAAQYLTYSWLLDRHHVSSDAYSFLRFLRDQCEQMSFRSGGSSGAGAALGGFGYLFKALEMSGFVAGTMIPSLVLFAAPYCKGCQRYLKKLQAGFVNSDAQRGDVFGRPSRERAAAIEASAREVVDRAQAIRAELAPLALDDALARLGALDPTRHKGAAATVQVTLRKCPTCDAHHLEFMLTHATADRRQASRSLGPLDKTEPAAAA